MMLNMICKETKLFVSKRTNWERQQNCLSPYKRSLSQVEFLGNELLFIDKLSNLLVDGYCY